MPKYEYREMSYLHHARREGLERLNALGAEGWKPAFAVGRTVVMMREVGDDASDWIMRGTGPKAEATVDDWREVYPTLPDEILEGIDADGVAEIMGGDFELPTRTTLNRWAEEARESVGDGNNTK